MIHIPAPCPVRLSRMNKTNCGFYCSSCTKNVVDYRGMTEKQISCLIEPGGCGIFDAEVVKVPSTFRTVKKQIAFYTLTLCSLIGFNVSPVSAQSENTKNPTGRVSINYDHKKDIEAKKKNRLRNYIFWRKKRPTGEKNKKGVIFMGCPSF